MAAPRYASIEPYLEEWKMAKSRRERNSFKTPLVVECMPSGKRFRLFKQFTYHNEKSGVNIIVPAGFETDFASIPRFARILIPKLGRWNKAAVLHDWLYSKSAYQYPNIVPRKLPDLIFLDGMKDLGVVKWKRTLMYWAVRLFGWMSWRKR